MPIWLISALALIAPFIGRIGGALGSIGTRSLVTGGAVGLGTAELTGAIDLIPGFGPGGGLFGGGRGRVVVRRRKKALTNTDMATMALIASVVSKKAAENFVLMRVRR